MGSWEGTRVLQVRLRGARQKVVGSLWRKGWGLTSRKHEEILKAPLTHGGGCLAGQSLIVIIENDDLAVGIFLDPGSQGSAQTNKKPPRCQEDPRPSFLNLGK